MYGSKRGSSPVGMALDSRSAVRVPCSPPRTKLAGRRVHASVPEDGGGEHSGTNVAGHGSTPLGPQTDREIAFSLTADTAKLHGAWNALAKLADVAGEVSICATATLASGYDRARLENGVFVLLRELELVDEDNG